MSEKPINTVDADEESQNSAAKSAEDRKAASAMAALDINGTDDSNGANAVDQDAMNKAIKGLSKSGAAKTAAKAVKVDQADVLLLTEQLELNKLKATELLKQHDGNAVKAMVAFIGA
ncbi:hypothetical protein HOO65_070304 [Ceratocystis lukuohia]|uniref:Nascent polypeptide-associated complex subunit alpha-like UBA domain-containing protein n=2 Tax=Ceratocystis TaxID=5157 RepID=A0A0F8BRF8_CERFI|nr:hypothetical protein CFO_g2499 [Ceratocystis platani]